MTSHETFYDPTLFTDDFAPVSSYIDAVFGNTLRQQEICFLTNQERVFESPIVPYNNHLDDQINIHIAPSKEPNRQLIEDLDFLDFCPKNKRICPNKTTSTLLSPSTAHSSIDNSVSSDPHNSPSCPSDTSEDVLPFDLDTEAGLREFEDFVAHIDEANKQGSDVRKRHQNDKRNIPGLIAKRVIKGIKKVLNGKEHRELEYIQAVFKRKGFGTDNASNMGLLSYLKEFSKAGKTYKWFKSVALTNVYYGGLVGACIDSFLSEEGKRGFSAWVGYSRMGEETRKILKEEKNSYKRKFEEKVWKYLGGL